MPGLVMMAVINNSYTNVVSSFYSTRFIKCVDELLIAPVPNWVILSGYVAGGVIRGILVGIVYWLTYLRGERAMELVAARPWVKAIIPPLRGIKLENPAPVPLTEAVRAQIEEIIRVKLEEPALLDRGGKALLAVLSKARYDSGFLARLTENPSEALKDYDLTSEERAALLSGDIRWIESKLGVLDEPLRTWLTARLAQEKW